MSEEKPIELGPDYPCEYNPGLASVQAELVVVRERLASADLDRIRLRAGLREALDLGRRIALDDVGDVEARAEMAELARLVQP